jgi:hypothetical protein
MIDANSIESLFGTFSFLAAAWAARLWFVASVIKIPSFVNDSFEGKGPFSDALSMQSKTNAKAALWAGIAAVFQALSIGSKIFLPHLGI